MKKKFESDAEYREYQQHKQKKKHKSDYARHGNKKGETEDERKEKKGGV